MSDTAQPVPIGEPAPQLSDTEYGPARIFDPLDPAHTEDIGDSGRHSYETHQILSRFALGAFAGSPEVNELADAQGLPRVEREFTEILGASGDLDEDITNMELAALLAEVGQEGADVLDILDTISNLIGDDEETAHTDTLKKRMQLHRAYTNGEIDSNTYLAGLQETLSYYSDPGGPDSAIEQALGDAADLNRPKNKNEK